MGRETKILVVVLGIVALSCCHGRSIPVTAGIFGFGSNEKSEKPPPPMIHPPMNRPPPDLRNDPRYDPRHDSRNDARRATTPPTRDAGPGKLPPPPPPPPPGSSQSENKDSKGRVGDSRSHQDERASLPPPPPFWGSGFNPYPFGGPGWMTPPEAAWAPPPQNWQRQQSFYPQEGEEITDFQQIQRALDETLARESELIGQVQNLTSSIATFQQREDLHTRQLDVLTERVMDAEAQTASERNALVEYEANCTELGHALAVLQDEIQEWQYKCANLTARHEADEEKLMDMLAEVKARNAEVEQFATIVEKSRLADERDRYMAERIRKKKQRGFFAWLFGIGDNLDDEEERLQELARSTLLRALQTERDNVHELEAVLSILQQNNSAISEMVESRDELIYELNERVAVFEEDKLVLKAALRQLQKEMADEAPKTQKLIDDLRSAREQVNKLKNEVDSLIGTHEKELSLLKVVIDKKQIAITETESNLTVIGSYVDKLEERLATFAIARRDIEVREQACNNIEKKSAEVEQKCLLLQKQAVAYEAEHHDLKKLLEELVVERSALQKEKVELQKDRDSLVEERIMLRATIATLEENVTGLDQLVNEWKSMATELETSVNQQRYQLDEYAWRESERERIENEASEVAKRGELEQIELAFEQDILEQATFDLEFEAEQRELENSQQQTADEVATIEIEIPPIPDCLSVPEDLDIPDLPDFHIDLDEDEDMEVESNIALPPPALPDQANDTAPSLSSLNNSTAPPNRPPPPGHQRPNGGNAPPRRNVPLRKLRKTFSKATGIHGMFTTPSHRRPPRPGPLASMKRTLHQYTSQLSRSKK